MIALRVKVTMHKQRRYAPQVLAGRLTRTLLLPALAAGLLVCRSPAASQSPARKATTVTEGAMRLLYANCLGCHSADKHKGGLQLASRAAALKGGDDGPVLVPGKPDKSLLLKALSADADPHMPPKKQLSTNQ